MGDWVKKVSAVLIGLGILTGISLEARECCRQNTLGFSGGADALYWKPIAAPYSYGSIGPGSNNRLLFLKPDYKWGARAYATYTNPCYFANLSYTWYEAYDAVRVANRPGLNPVGGGSGTIFTAAANTFFQYYNVDARVGRILYQRCGTTWYAFSALKWAFMSQRGEYNNTFNDETNGRYRQISKFSFNGVGLGGGIGGECSLWQCLKGFVEFNAVALIGKQKVPHDFVYYIQDFVDEFTINKIHPSYTSVVPGIDFRLGLNYLLNLWKLKTKLEVGYELDYYFKPFNTLDINIVFTNENLGFAGPYAGVSFLF